MPEFIKTRAIVLSGRDMGESDRLITFISPSLGKIKGIAKGAKRSKKRFVNVLEPFTLLNLTLAVSTKRAGTLKRIDSAEIENCFAAIRNNVGHFAVAGLGSELVEMWIREDDPCPNVFALLKWFLEAVESADNIQKLALFFQIRLLAAVGFGSEFERCRRCGKRPEGDKVHFVADKGGFLCCKCNRAKITNLSLGALNTMRFMAKCNTRQLPSLYISKNIMVEVWQMMRNLHVFHLGKMPKSYNVLRSLGIIP